jgi:hypothetical protein
VESSRHTSDDDDHRVIAFRPRAWRARRRSAGKPSTTPQFDPARSPVPDLSIYEDSESDEEYEHRMLMNALAALCACVLIVLGLVLANSMLPPDPKLLWQSPMAQSGDDEHLPRR